MCFVNWLVLFFFFFFFFNDTATTEIYTLSLHDALRDLADPGLAFRSQLGRFPVPGKAAVARRDRKSTRLNSSQGSISYAVFCLKKKKKRPHVNSVMNSPHGNSRIPPAL